MRTPLRKIFALGVLGLIVTEIANVYFIMPMPGSQRMRSIDAAYTIYSWRWQLRILFAVLIAIGAPAAWRAPGWRKWLMPTSLAVVAAVTVMFNFFMSADHMFLQPTVLKMVPASRNTVKLDRLVVGVDMNGEARAYPLRFIGYHHQVLDSIGGKPVLVTYCTVCRTGRVYAPIVNGHRETFRLVGMDHFNAMLEDRATGSWWRQANGEAITGPLKGTMLPELPYQQVTLKEWLALHPGSLVMQGDTTFKDEYSKDYAYERGTSRRSLTGTDTIAWHDKSWVVGVTIDGRSKAFDWLRLRKERVVNDFVGPVPVVVVLARDNASYFAFRRPDSTARFALRGDSLVNGGTVYALTGEGSAGRLDGVNASQEFWHSWRTFQPRTERY